MNNFSLVYMSLIFIDKKKLIYILDLYMIIYKV